MPARRDLHERYDLEAIWRQFGGNLLTNGCMKEMSPKELKKFGKQRAAAEAAEKFREEHGEEVSLVFT